MKAMLALCLVVMVLSGCRITIEAPDFRDGDYRTYDYDYHDPF